MTPLLPGLDALVTDYSSLAFDAALVPLPVVFLAPDVEAYARTRGFYGSYADVAGDGLGDGLDGGRRAAGRAAGRRERAGAAGRARPIALSARVHAFRDGGNTRRVYRAILAGLARRQPGLAPDHERTSMTDARFSTDGGATLIVSGVGSAAGHRSSSSVRARASSGPITGRGTTWRAVLPLRASRWGGAELPLPTGEYELRIEHAADGATPSRRHPSPSPSSARCAPRWREPP